MMYSQRIKQEDIFEQRGSRLINLAYQDPTTNTEIVRRSFSNSNYYLTNNPKVENRFHPCAIHFLGSNTPDTPHILLPVTITTLIQIYFNRKAEMTFEESI